MEVAHVNVRNTSIISFCRTKFVILEIAQEPCQSMVFLSPSPLVPRGAYHRGNWGMPRNATDGRWPPASTPAETTEGSAILREPSKSHRGILAREKPSMAFLAITPPNLTEIQRVFYLGDLVSQHSTTRFSLLAGIPSDSS